jgi:hypothetical protein
MDWVATSSISAQMVDLQFVSNTAEHKFINKPMRRSLIEISVSGIIERRLPIPTSCFAINLNVFGKANNRRGTKRQLFFTF